MPKLRSAVIAGAAALLFAGAAVAATAKLHTMQVNLPDGSVAQITYVGDVAPKVAIAPAEAQAAAYADPFAAIDRNFARISAMMALQQQQAMQQVAAMERQAATTGAQSGKIFIAGNAPASSNYSYTIVSSSTGHGSCTQTLEWRSDGLAQQPQVVRASSGDCGVAKNGKADKPEPVSSPQKAAPGDTRSI
jgi:hypothetical protein